ncbi:hypothetical protein PT974_01168 [Cladobotryum mycophilum]|uniref:Uncharacterized protein n=1 Tax=Cladobotryum mycophilum TaxID=491253 RepID=A0ABR0T2X0_9HYPO
MEAVTRAPLRLRLCPKLSPLSQLVQRPFTTTAPLERDGKSKKQWLQVKRFVPEEARKFVKLDGKLMTTKENEEFMLKYDLEPDNGTMVKLAGKDLGKTASMFNTTIAFSRKHIIIPYDLKFFDPRGHPLASAIRKRYAEKVDAEPLWIMTSVAGGASAVVRSTAARQLKEALIKSLGQLGYNQAPGKGEARQIKGTLWLTIHNPVAITAMNEVPFANTLANYLHNRHSKGIR